MREAMGIKPDRGEYSEIGRIVDLVFDVETSPIAKRAAKPQNATRPTESSSSVTVDKAERRTKASSFPSVRENPLPFHSFSTEHDPSTIMVCPDAGRSQGSFAGVVGFL